MTAEAYQKKFEPMRLKELMANTGIPQAELARAASMELGRNVSRATINLVINRGYEPTRMDGLRDAVEHFVAKRPKAIKWLLTRNMALGDIWEPLGKDLRLAKPEGYRKSGRHIEAGNVVFKPVEREVEMISQEAMKHFKIFRNPFVDDIQKDSDVYMSDEHRYIEAAMLDAARHGGFLAVIGEVGSGKSVMRRKMVEQLRQDGNTLVIYPQMIDKSRLTAASICDSVILDISNERCKAKLEDKTRQVQRLLLDRAKAGYRHVLIVEEAHDLKIQTLKYLKRFYELEDGYRKLLGIVLIGQTELKNLFNEGHNVDMREVIRRVQVAEIKGLNGNLADYLRVKFARVGRDIGDIFSPDAYEALSKRLTSTGRDGKSKISHAYPLLVNNYVARAMNAASELGEAKISAEVINAL